MCYFDIDHTNFKILICSFSACNDACWESFYFIYFGRFWHCIYEFWMQSQVCQKSKKRNMFQYLVSTIVKLWINWCTLVPLPLIFHGTFARYSQIKYNSKILIWTTGFLQCHNKIKRTIETNTKLIVLVFRLCYLLVQLLLL